MKRIVRTKLLSTSNVQTLILLLILSLGSTSLMAQDDDSERDTRPVRNMFESIWLIDNQTVVVPIQGTFEFDIQHRFGTWEDGYDSFYGIFNPSNIRMGLNYVPVEKLQLGFGFAKDNRLIDFHAKYALFQQGRSGGSPLSVTYMVNMAIDSREKKKSGFEEATDHFSYFNQLMIARKVTDGLSIQASGNLSYFNHVPQSRDAEGNLGPRGTNMTLSASFMARQKITPSMGLIANFDVPFTDDEINDPKPNISFGIELVSSSHAFQIFVGNYKWMVPQYNHAFNGNEFGENQILIGFNMTRLWNF